MEKKEERKGDVGEKEREREMERENEKRDFKTEVSYFGLFPFPVIEINCAMTAAASEFLVPCRE